MKTKHLILALLTLLASSEVRAADFYADGIYYNYSGSNVTVTYFDNEYNTYSGNVTIPSSVTRNNKTYSVTSIGARAFYDCTGLTSVTIPNSVTSIGESAFDCSSLTSITIPNSVTSIGRSAFNYCSDLTSVTISNRVTSIGANTFRGCRGLSSVIIPESVTSVGDYAFNGCSSLTSVTIPSSVTSIGNNAFNGCSSLTCVKNFSNTPQSISSSTFSNRANATLYVPKGKKGAYEAANYWKEFKNIEESISFTDANVETLCVANWDTDGNGELDLVEAAAVTSIGSVFSSNTSITSFDELQYFTGLTTINDYAFLNCTGLTSITIPESVSRIGIYAFQSNGLTSITIPESVTRIGNAAFLNCSSLTRAEFASIESLCNISFDNSSSNPLYYAHHLYINGEEVKDVVIPESVTNISMYTFSGCTGLTSLSVESGNTKYDSRNNCNAIIETETNTLVRGYENTVIPNTVTSIGILAFDGCSGLTSITIPESVTSIGNGAFQACDGFLSVSIPESVTSFGNYIFYGCSNLSVTLNSRDIVSSTYSSSSNLGTIFGSHVAEYIIAEGVTSIGDYAFYGCSGLTSITIPNSVAGIGNFAFSNCSSLTSVTIPGNVTSIGNYAFADCSSLTSLTIGSDVTSIGSYAFYGCSALTRVSNLSETPQSIGSDVFSHRGNATLYVPSGCKSAYEAATYWQTFKEIIEIPAVNVGSTGFATFCSPVDMDFSGVSDIKAYIASGFNPSTGTLVLTRVTEVPAGEGLYIVGDEGSYDVPATTTDMVYSNLLKGVTTATTISPTASAGELAGGKAYLQLPTASVASVKAINVVFNDEETAIKDVEQSPNVQGIYNLQGQQVNAPRRGLYIINGKKVIIK